MPRSSRPVRRSMFAGVALVVVASVGACAPAPPTASAPADRSIVFPLAVAIRFSDTFGAPRSGGRTHEGQDLMAPKGTVAVAAASGTVTSVRHDSSGLSGNMLRITDADGWQYVYIHLNNDTPGTDDGANRYEQAFADGIRKGQRVVAGEPVGYVGDSGNAESTGAHLHFEIRRPDGSVVNAAPSLWAAPVAPRSAADVAATAPSGVLDSASSDAPGSVRVAGWVVDRVVSDPADVSVYVDGNPVTTTTADLDRPDLAAVFPDQGTRHGFDVQVTGLAAGSRRVCVVGHNAGDGGGSARFGCGDVVVG